MTRIQEILKRRPSPAPPTPTLQLLDSTQNMLLFDLPQEVIILDILSKCGWGDQVRFAAVSKRSKAMCKDIIQEGDGFAKCMDVVDRVNLHPIWERMEFGMSLNRNLHQAQMQFHCSETSKNLQLIYGSGMECNMMMHGVKGFHWICIDWYIDIDVLQVQFRSPVDMVRFTRHYCDSGSWVIGAYTLHKHEAVLEGANFMMSRFPSDTFYVGHVPNVCVARLHALGVLPHDVARMYQSSSIVKQAAALSRSYRA